ncbi:MAG: inositol-3-phosphate synthase [Candidatus Altiarchaeota archaeon]|nr:inositol-3-phosphate synthase [Candidatus Altiarchaeota archaeon]
MEEIRVALAGIGNCASSLVQGVEYYKNTDESSSEVSGLMHNVLGGYRIKDIRFVAAFDIDKRKIGKDLSEAIYSGPNCTTRFSDVPKVGVEVLKGPVLDGVAETTRESFLVDGKQVPVDVPKILKETKADVFVSYLPVGSEQATKYYAESCLDAGVAFINAIPVFIASDPAWAKRFAEKGLPIIGDDIKSQVGATIVHRMLTKLFVDRGVKLIKTYQMNVGGNTDFQNMLERKRLKSKKISKTEAVQSQLKDRMQDEDIHIGPSDHIPWLKDNKVCFIRMEGRKFGDVPLTLDLRLSVEDSPNSAGIMVDAIRCCKLALDRKIAGPLTSPSSYFMKHPPEQYSDPEARIKVEEFIEGRRER